MKIKERLFQTLSMLVLAAMMTQTIACGTLLYPERRNANPHNRIDPAGRRIDPAVAVLDAACLIIFIVPGIIAFAVDFATGAIYLPGGRQSAALSDDPEENRVIYVDPETLNPDTIKQIIRQNKGVEVSFEDNRMQAYLTDHI
ncbi:MAG: hypothetical protein Q7U02_03060 [Desulfosalsimonadaceae bacterium]|nr:hypothetical protein [Desulfosalsimonadaceae bacterium]